MAIKSFQGSRRQQQKLKAVDQLPVRVCDYMTKDLITFRTDQKIFEVVEILIRHRISGGPVVNDNNELVGIISEGDCLKQISDNRYYNMPVEKDTVGDRMMTNVDTLDGNMNVFDAASIFLESKHRRFPILENGKLVGQISQKDVLKAALEMKGHTWDPKEK
ncbi:CBS domain-containing protein [Gelidibacter maritimus]|uniref:CBS domain-containing protein n=1 Tax=Gelidibacter maritimus TaxID=2761487 RepID=A0A7W2M3L0_9FLAO|nr:CBS domain-containing protein [Gelidibacter maritimus]MBA6152073.1 CBS domain-containing protein [Gelidibacter maritimus]